MRDGFGVVRQSRSIFQRRAFLPPAYSLPLWGVGALRSQAYSSVSAVDLQFGQPLHETHPHLLQAGELTPGISAFEYAQRRSRLASKLPKNGIAILAASDLKYRSGPVFYEFHQNSDFFYLTGFNEPEAVAVVGKSATEDDHVFHLFVRAKDPRLEQWEGSRSGPQAAVDVFNADESGDIKDVEGSLSRLIGDASEIYTDASPSTKSTSAFTRLFSSRSPSAANGLSKLIEKTTVKPLRSILNDLRSIKSDAEIGNMRKAGRASGRAFTQAMRQAWTMEKDLNAFLEYNFKRNGCDASAYVPVVAGGKVIPPTMFPTSSILIPGRTQVKFITFETMTSFCMLLSLLKTEYNTDLHHFRDSNLVVADAGGEYGNYITDITRTWPVSGTFTPAQKDLYNTVLATQRTCISLCRATASNSLDKIHQIAEQTLKDSLSQLGFDMSGNALETLFFHHLGHYIGLDVHDTPGESRKTPLQAGQCVTVEPGIYVPDTDRWPAAFRGMGIRIEDSVCVQEEHPLVLTTEAVKEV
ncbi:MAG: hypothetical protein Q9219_000905 [cf. Caloplaca sp. 3 TL-2023]